MRLGDTIAALCTGPSHAPRAVVRLSGPATGLALRMLGVNVTLGAGAHRVVLRLPARWGVAELPALVVVFKKPRSFTGEDAAEVQLPGNPQLVQRVLQLVLQVAGVRLAEPGEYAARAFLSGKLTA